MGPIQMFPFYNNNIHINNWLASECWQVSGKRNRLNGLSISEKLQTESDEMYYIINCNFNSRLLF